MNVANRLNQSSRAPELRDDVSEASINESLINLQQRQGSISGVIRVFALLIGLVAFLISYKIYL